VKSSLVLLAILALAIQGCSLYRPKSAVPSNYIKQISADLGNPDLVKNYDAMPQGTDAETAAKVARRNQILTEMIYLVDQNYYKFESHFYGGQAVFSTAADTANLGSDRDSNNRVYDKHRKELL
jgi:hypothetical protein